MNPRTSVSHASVALTAAISLILFVAGFAFLAQPAQAAVGDRAPLSVLPGELVVNGGATDGTNGWTSGLQVHAYGAGGYPSNVVLSPAGTIPDSGAAMFSGSGATSSSEQTIDLSAASVAIDDGVVEADLEAYIGGYADQADRGEVEFEFRDASDVVVQSTLLPAVTNVERGNVSGFLRRADSVTLQSGVRSVVVSFNAIRSIAPANDGYVDNISLRLFAPVPEAVADTEETVRNQDVTIDAPANDLAPTGATIDRTSLRLLDGGTEVTTITNGDGTYTVDVATGIVTFEPANDFVGIADVVPYRIADSRGQESDSTITVTVTFTPAPGLTLTKSAHLNDANANGLADVGETIDYTFNVANTGNVDIEDVAVNDDKVTGLAPTSADIDEGQSQAFTSDPYTVTSDDVKNGTLSNSASASGTYNGVTITSNTDTVDVETFHGTAAADGDAESSGLLPDTGGPVGLTSLTAALMAIAAGGILVRRRTRRGQHIAS